MKQILIAGNWKMHKNLEDAIELASRIVEWTTLNNPRAGVAICPPFPFLHPLKNVVEGSKVRLGAQNCHYEAEGAYTGEVSPRMLASLGCEFVIIGHSERRAYFNENDKLINRKLLAALKYGLKPIFCIGETLQEREQGQTFSVIERQIRAGLNNVADAELEAITIAYEPVWAIGTGISASTNQIDEAHNFIRKLLRELYGRAGENVLILYGGSLNSKNAPEILALNEVYGGLIGKASLDAEEFTKIINFAEQVI